MAALLTHLNFIAVTLDSKANTPPAPQFDDEAAEIPTDYVYMEAVPNKLKRR